jgi:RNA polymerase sigma-70 factor (ECF subfamily)
VDITNRYMDLLLGHDAVSQHEIRPRQADTGSLVRSTRTRRRYVRAAYAVRDNEPAPAVPDAGEPPARLGRITFAHAMARLTAAQRRTVQLRYLDGYPRDAAARLMDRSTEAVRDLERRGLRHLQAALTTPPTPA